MTFLKPAVSSPPMNGNEGFSGRAWLLIVGLVIAIWFAGLGYRPLLSPDEGRYSEIAREMAASNDFVTPRLNGLRYFEKPPLQYWLTALAFKVFGESDGAARLVTALYGLGTAAVVYLCLLRLRGRASAQLGFLLTAGTCWVVAMGHFVALDMGLAFWLTVVVCGLLACLERERAEDARWADLWVWVGMAGGFLSKGLVAGVIPVASVLLTALVSRSLKPIVAVRWWPGLPVFLALVLPWLIAVQLQNPGFFEFFFIREHFQRFTTKLHRRVEPWWYFVPVLLMAGLPWLGHWLAALKTRIERPGKRLADRMLWCWSGFIFVFFSLSGSKLPSYILPMLPTLALWLAGRGPQLSGRQLRAALVAPVAAGLLLVGLAAMQTVRPAADTSGALAEYVPWILFAGLTLLAASLAAWRQAQRGFADSILPLALGMLLATQLLQWGHATQSEHLSAKGLAARLVESEGQGLMQAPFYCVGNYDQTLPFYLRRTLTLVDYRDEMDMGLTLEPARNGPTEAALRAEWAGAPLSYALLDAGGERAWREAGLPMRMVARNARRVVVANR